MLLIRVLVIGDTGVGKTSLLLRFYDGSFTAASKSTIGVDYKAKEVTINEEEVKLQVWDTAGQERFRSMTAAFFGKAQGALVVFDVGDLDSFNNLNGWIDEIQQAAPEGCAIIICANKVDLPPERWQVTRDMFTNFAAQSGFPLLETSASSGKNSDQAFIDLGRMVLETHRDKLTDIRESVSLYDIPKEDPKKKKEPCAC